VNHREGQVIPLSPAARRAEIGPHGRTMVLRIRQAGCQRVFIAKLPASDGRIIPITSDYFAHVLSHESLCFALRIRPPVQWFSHDIQHGCTEPEQRWKHPNAMLLKSIRNRTLKLLQVQQILGVGGLLIVIDEFLWPAPAPPLRVSVHKAQVGSLQVTVRH
jgi:hypothetical protein